ncbi:hypothetical protein DOE63_02475 [Salmonella enterica subsp. diarizonae serovar 59:z10:-]|nr:hypothetical protein DOE63_02475 [Salmonella enterica subsp. diarizonae serovar 59:z10:-]
MVLSANNGVKPMKTFEGFSLEQADAFANISLLIETGMLLTASTNERTEEMGDIVLGMAKKYSQAASQKYVYGNHSTTQQATAVGTTNQRFTIGTRIRQLRKDQGITAADLAHMIGEPEDIITQWESDIGEPVLSFAIPLCQALRCDLNWLITGEGNNVKPAQPAPVNVMKGADLANIGVRIESRRNQIMMSVDKLAEKIDTSGAMIREWETGKAIPHSDYIDKLAKALNTTVTWLMTGKDITA